MRLIPLKQLVFAACLLSSFICLLYSYRFQQPLGRGLAHDSGLKDAANVTLGVGIVSKHCGDMETAESRTKD